MKKYLWVFIFIINHFNGFSQDWIYSTVVKGSSIEPKYSCIDNQNNLLIVSTFTDTVFSSINEMSFGGTDLIIFKYNQTGGLLWYKHIGSLLGENAAGITVDNQNNIYIVGNYQSDCIFKGDDTITNSGGNDVFLAKYNNDGLFQWAKRICGSSNTQGATDIIYDGINNNIVIAGFFKDSLIIGDQSTIYCDTILGRSISSSFISVFDLNGNLLNKKIFFQDYDLTRLNKISVCSNGYFFSGNFRQNFYLDVDTISSLTSGSNDAFIYKTNFGLNGNWVRRIRGLLSENYKSLTTDEYDNVYILGNYNSSIIYIDSTENLVSTKSGTTGGVDTYIGKFNRSGVLQWFFQKGGTGNDYYNDFVIRENIIYSTGYFANQIIFNNDTLRTSSVTNSDAFLVAFNEVGDPIAGESVIGSGNYPDAGIVVKMDSYSRAYVSGYYRSPQIQIGDSIYTSNNLNKSDLFFAIYEHPLKAVITDERNVNCNGLSTGMLTVTPYFGMPPYTYKWSHNPSLNSPVADNIPAGNYTVTVIDGDMDSATISGTVYQSAPLSSSGVITNVSCYNDNDGEIDLAVSGGTIESDYTYAWTSYDGSGVNPVAQDQNGLNRGTYYVTIKDDHLCEIRDTFVITQPDPITFANSLVSNVENPSPPGELGSVDLHVQGGTPAYTYNWSTGAITEDISGLLGGNYTVQVTDSEGCLGDTTFFVDNDTMLVAVISAKTDVACKGDATGYARVSIQNATGNITYSWRDVLSNPVGGNFDYLSNVPANTYIVRATEDGTGRTAEAQVIISEPAQALSLFANALNLTCANNTSGVIDLSVTGGTMPYTFDWSNDSVSEDLVNIPAGNYSVTVTDGKLCQQILNQSVTQPSSLSLNISIDNSILCNGDKTAVVTANANGGTGILSYLWNDPGNQTTKTATALEAGTYMVVVTDENECEISDDITVLQPGVINISSAIQNPLCPGQENGQIIPTVSGGVAPYVYIWEDGWTQRIYPELGQGTYNLTVWDNNNCQKPASFQIIDPLPMNIQEIQIADPSCSELNNGTIQITATGGNGTYEYSNGGTFQASPEFTDLTGGDYIVTARDGNDCMSPDSVVTLIQPAGIDFTSEVTANVTCFGYSNGIISIHVPVSGAYTYSLNNGLNYFDNQGMFTNVPPGEYHVKVNDGNCEYTGDTLTLTQPDAIALTSVVDEITCHGASDGIIEITATGGSGAYSYSVNDGGDFQSSNLFADLDEGFYSLRVRDVNNCQNVENTVTLTDPEEILIDTAGVIHVTNGNNGEVFAELTGGISPVNFVLRQAADSVVSVSEHILNLSPGNCLLYAVDDNNCFSDSIQFVILNNGVQELIIYDAFSPNNDDKNPVWNIGNIHRYPNCKVKIFNSWGNLVFSSNGYEEPWDGTFNGKVLPAGTYYYVIDPGDGSETLSGPVNIVY